MTIPCTLPRSGNYLFEPSQQHFVDHPVHYTPVIINAENDNLPVHFINHSDHEIDPDVSPTVTCCPTNVNHCVPFFRKTLVSSNPVLLTSPVSPLSNIIFTLVMLNPSSKERTAPATIIIRKSKSRWRRCYKTVLSNLVLVLGPFLLCWLQKQIKHYHSV